MSSEAGAASCSPCSPGSASAFGSAACTACGAGSHAEKAGSVECEPCDIGRTSLLGSANCSLCALEYYGVGSLCKRCAEGTDCSVEGSTLVSLKLEPGWYRFAMASEKIYECPLHSEGVLACKGGANVSDRVCSGPYHGPLCSRCKPGHYRDMVTKRCASCADTAAVVTPLVFTTLVVVELGVTAAFSNRYLLYEFYEERKERIDRITSHMTLVFIITGQVRGSRVHALGGDQPRNTIEWTRHIYFMRIPWKIYLGVIRMNFLTHCFLPQARPPFSHHLTIHPPQVMVNLQHAHQFVGGSGYPPPFNQLISAVDMITLDFAQIFRVDCDENYTGFDSKLRMATLLPIGVSVIILIIQAAIMALQGGGRMSRGKGTQAVLMLCFFSLPMTSSVITSAFKCEEFDVGGAEPLRVMAADMLIECGTSKHTSIIRFASVALAAIPFGVPLGIGVMLWSRRDEIASRKTQDGGKDLATLSFLFRDFAPEFGWWMPVVDLFRRLALSSFLLLFEYESSQVLAALIISICFVVAFRELKPYYDASTDALGYTCGVSLTGMFEITRTELTAYCPSPLPALAFGHPQSHRLISDGSPLTKCSLLPIHHSSLTANCSPTHALTFPSGWRLSAR